MYVPEFAVFSTSGPTGCMFVDSPFNKTSVTVPSVDGVHWTVYGCPTGTTEVKPGALKALPLGESPVALVYAFADARRARAAAKTLNADIVIV